MVHYDYILDLRKMNLTISEAKNQGNNQIITIDFCD